ncbi:MAG: sulfotransferase, partial [Pseudomonadota bacterium]
AEEASRKALALDPESPETKIDLADILYLSDRYAEAETLVKETIEDMPNDPRLQIKLSAFLERSGNVDGAIEAADKAIELSPEMPEAYHRRAMILFTDNRIEAALEALAKALELKPNFPVALGTKSELLQSHGDMDGARQAAIEALDINPNLAFLYYTFSKVNKFTEDDPHLKKMEELSAKENILGMDQSAALNFALFKAYEDIGDYDKSFAVLKKGNDFKRSTVVFDMQTQDNTFSKIKEIYTDERIKTFEGKGCKDDAPIFIVGMPRSGTTLTEQIISSHPDVFGAGELYYLSNLEKELDPLIPENASEWGEKYLEHVRNIHPDAAKAKKLTDKMPGNFMRIGQILATLPNAKIIHCRRNPVDTSLSCYKQLFSRGHYWTYNLDELAIHYGLYADMMDHWREHAPNTFMEIYYEDTVNDFENQARKLIDYVGLDWNDACLTPHKTKRSILTASKGQVRKPIYKTSVEAWRRYEEQLSGFAQKLEPYMRKKS